MPRVLLISRDQELKFIKSIGSMKRYLDLLQSSLYCNIEDEKEIDTIELKNLVETILDDLSVSENCISEEWDGISSSELKDRFRLVNSIFKKED